MKKRIAIGLGVLMVAVSALAAGLNTYDGNTFQELLAPTNISANTTGTVFNVGPYKGIASVLLTVGNNPANASGTNTITIQHATASAGSYTTLTNEAGNAVTASVGLTAAGDTTVFKLDTAAAHQYLRAVATPADTTGTVSAVIVLPPK